MRQNSAWTGLVGLLKPGFIVTLLLASPLLWAQPYPTTTGDVYPLSQFERYYGFTSSLYAQPIREYYVNYNYPRAVGSLIHPWFSPPPATPRYYYTGSYVLAGAQAYATSSVTPAEASEAIAPLPPSPPAVEYPRPGFPRLVPRPSNPAAGIEIYVEPEAAPPRRAGARKPRYEPEGPVTQTSTPSNATRIEITDSVPGQ